MRDLNFKITEINNTRVISYVILQNILSIKYKCELQNSQKSLRKMFSLTAAHYICIVVFIKAYSSGGGGRLQRCAIDVFDTKTRVMPREIRGERLIITHGGGGVIFGISVRFFFFL